MKYLNSTDYCVIFIYFTALICLGLYLKKKASVSIEDYFLGGRRLPWWALGISGMASFLDITGTMMVVSFLYMLGSRGLFIEFRGGAVLVLVPTLLWVGKWTRRSRCITGAEWMIYRFGDDKWGQCARTVKAMAHILLTVVLLAYMVKGVGLFFSMFLPFSPLVCSLVMISVATIYTMFSGFYGVVYTDILQSGIILVAVIVISSMAILKVTDSQSLAALANEVTGSTEWLSSAPHFHTSMPKGYEDYESLFVLAMFYLVNNVLRGMSGADSPVYFGARNDRECGTLTFLWTWLMMFRWPLMMGFAVLGLFLVKDLFPDQVVVLQTADLIKEHVGQVNQSQWAGTLAGIMNNPQNYSQELIAGLQSLLGDDWATKLKLVSFHGTVEPERILPAVLLFRIPKGLLGMFLVALIAASMSTFDSTVNAGTAFFTRDIYQRYLRPKANNKELIYTSWCFGLLMVICGFMIGYKAKSISHIFGWIIMGFWGGMLVPTFLRFYWWRFNGGGFAIGTTVGVCAAIIQRTLYPDLNDMWQFAVMVVIGLIGAVTGTYLTKPTDGEVLKHFYKTTRPFGFWGHLKKTVSPEVRAAMVREHRNDLLAFPFTLCWQVSLFLLPMLLIVRNFSAFGITLSIFIISLIGMYFLWYRNLPPHRF